MPTVKIREALKTDLKAVIQLYSALEGEDYQPLNLRQAEQIYDRMQQYPNYHVYIAEIENEAVGTFELLIMDNLARMGEPSAVVEDVVVRTDWQGHGIGKTMMQFAMEQCRQAGCYKLTLSSNVKRKVAHAFYESLGFKQHGYSYCVDLRK